MPTTSLFIYSLSGTLFEGPVTLVRVPAKDGELSLLPSHAPTVTALTKGVIHAHTNDDDGGREFSIEKGMLYVDQKNIICLVSE